MNKEKTILEIHVLYNQNKEKVLQEIESIQCKIKEEIVGECGNLTKNDISGSKNISNKADNIISIERNWEEGDAKICDAIFTSLKDRESGKRKIIRYNFNKNTLRFYNNNTKSSIVYGWDKANYKKKQIEEDMSDNPFTEQEEFADYEPF